MHWHFIDWVGFIGGILFLFAFWRTSIGKWTGRSLWYELDNLLGAILMSIYAYKKGAYVNIGLNLVWGVVAIRGVTSYAERRMHRKKLRATKVSKRRK
jgi:hypothetical protein